MKTLVNKQNPQIRITAPEIVLWANKEEYLIAGIPQTARTYLTKEWTLIEEEPKYTEVWVEGRTIFEQEGEPIEDWREKRKEECPFRRTLDNNLYGCERCCERYEGVVCVCDGNCSWVVDYPKFKELQDKKEQKPEAKLTGWVARDREYNPYFGLGLVIFNGKPKRTGNCWSGEIAAQLPWELFPDLKCEDGPMEVEITIRRK